MRYAILLFVPYISCMPPRGQRNPKAGFQPGKSGNPNGRPKVGLSLAEKVRALVGGDGRKLVKLWTSIAFDEQADVKDRLTASRLLAERGFGVPKQELEHSGTIILPVRIVDEFHAS